MHKDILKFKRRSYRTINNEIFVLNEPTIETSHKMKNVRSTATSIEMLLEFELKYSRLQYTKSKFIIGGLIGNPDFVIPKYKIAIFCDGDFWHGKNFNSEQIKNNKEFWIKKIEQNVNRDNLVNKTLNEEGWKVFRFAESEIKKSATRCIKTIKDYIEGLDIKDNNISFTFIDLFSGIGGFRFPIESLGGKCIGFSEIDKNAIETYKLNFETFQKDDELYLGDITKVDKICAESIDLVVGGVPCQAWSVAGKMKGFEDPRGKLWQDAIRVVEVNQPKVFVFENVKGLYDPRNRPNLELIISSLESAGYDIQPPALLNSFDFGVPQNRERIFIVGFRKDLGILNKFSYPKPIMSKIKLGDILENVNKNSVSKLKLDVKHIHGEKIPLSRNRFQKIDELNDFFILCDTRDGHSTIHSWDLINTTNREKEICLTILKNRRKKIYGDKDGNSLSFQDLTKIITGLKEIELENLITKKILKKINGLYEFVNSKNSSGINGTYRIYMPNSDIFSTLTATGTKDMVALESVGGKSVEEFKENFIKEIYKKQKFRPITGAEAGKLQGFPNNFAMHTNPEIAKKQFGNAVSIPVIYYLIQQVIKTGVFENGAKR